MEITVKLFATLRQGRFKSTVYTYGSAPKISDIIDRLSIAEEDLAIILVNGKNADLDTGLADGDTLALFPPVGGG